MRLEKVIDAIEDICPITMAEEWDNCGFQLRCENEEIDKVLVSLEVTDEIVYEAMEINADMIVTHHPLIFNPILCVDYNDITGKHILKLAESEITVYSCHTNFDKLNGGNNDYLGKLLELDNISPFDNGNGFCRMGNTPFAVTFAEFINRTSEILEIEKNFFNCVGDKTKILDKIGWCTGSGSEFILDAKNQGCDLFITGDVKYHSAQLAKELGICVLDIGHYGSEKIFTENMAEKLREVLDIDIYESKVDINPFL